MDNSSSKLEIRLFYVRILPCIVSTVPDHLSLNILRPDHHSTSLEINASLIPSSQPATVTLRRDRVDEDTSEVTYVTTDCLRIVGGVEFEVLDVEEVVLCGALERLDCATTTLSGGIKVGGGAGGWTMDCFTTANGVGNGRGKKKGFCSSQSIEVYVAGRCYNMPVILTKTVQAISPRQKRNGGLDVIFEDEERKEQNDDELALQPKWEASETELDGYEPEGKLVPNYSEDMYTGEDGQLTWFNAGVRVGVGIGLGMCLGVGIGVGLLMRSYQATTRNFKRRFI